MANQIEENLNNASDEFDNVNDEMNGAIDNVKEEFDTDMSPRKMFGVVSVKEMKKAKADASTFTQIVHQFHNQMSSKMGIKNVETEQWKALKKNLDNCT